MVGGAGLQASQGGERRARRDLQAAVLGRRFHAVAGVRPVLEIKLRPQPQGVQAPLHPGRGGGDPAGGAGGQVRLLVGRGQERAVGARDGARAARGHQPVVVGRARPEALDVRGHVVEVVLGQQGRARAEHLDFP
jgi:hypothetical protein